MSGLQAIIDSDSAYLPQDRRRWMGLRCTLIEPVTIRTQWHPLSRKVRRRIGRLIRRGQLPKGAWYLQTFGPLLLPRIVIRQAGQ